MKKNFLITTGGSGGHVLPAIILYEHLSKEANIILSTDKRGLKYLDKEAYKFEIIDTPKLNNVFFLPFNLIVILILTFKSLYLLKNKKIEKIFSTGGYMSLPLILASKLLRLKIYLIEPNQVLGRANRYFLNSCKKIFCYTKKIKNFPDNFQNKIITINPLVKKSTYNLKSLDEIKDKLTLLIVGGSQGANIFDKNLKNLIVNISKTKQIKIIQQTTEKNIPYLNNFYSKNNIENKIFSFDKDFYKSLQQADLCITRAGASTLAELSLMNIPFIAVPLPTSKDDHQFENANYYKINGCCWMIEQTSFEEKIEDLLKYIFNNKNDYLEKKENLKKLNYQNTWINVNQKILNTINEN
ncbi:UDP-N-acetylglucosamine--N-acetylmuramyl-(pentapeptide) pyrophosphoryl-undecaprenol N-acetylglucosamine transferase [Pelagibacterales bacterium SAG-MED07]|nr:UDP-N-acetylglucosamine--N-acetylmuramyl-(pentapeptide) pyrophosphoryl-undecaprenol N-acetylglucosamine transferase [Pelagibacterales bacterium SAG-MED07]